MSSTTQRLLGTTVLGLFAQASIAANAAGVSGRWYLYVTDPGSNQVKVLNSKYQVVRTIGGSGSGLNDPGDDWIDRNGNLYVANSPCTTKGSKASGNVREYAAGASSPTFTYSAGLKCPLSIATDQTGRVYVYDSASYVNVFPHGRNVAERRFKLPRAPQNTIYSPGGALSVDSEGNLFVEIYAYSWDPHCIVNCYGFYYTALYEYPSGLPPAQYLNVVAGQQRGGGWTLGVAFDSTGNLLVAWPAGLSGPGVIVIDPPPYTGSTQFANPSSLSSPINFALTPDGATLFVTNGPWNGPTNILVYAYPSWTLLQTLDKHEGFIDSYGLAIGSHP